MPRTYSAGFFDDPHVCMAAKIVRSDGTVVGLCDAQTSFSYGGVTYQPAYGVEASALAQKSGTSVDNLTIKTPRDGIIPTADLLAGRYNKARVYLYLFNWRTPGAPIVLGQHRPAKATLTDTDVIFEVLGLMSLWKQQVGRVLTKACDVEKPWDKRCDPHQTLKASFTFSRTVFYSPSPFVIDFTGDSNVAGYYSFGYLVFTSGSNNLLVQDVKYHSILTPATWAGGTTYEMGDYAKGSDTHVYVSLAAGNVGHNPVSTSGYWSRMASDPATIARVALNTGMPLTIAVGDTLDVTRGCDKLKPTCQSIVNSHNPSGSNIENFMGFDPLPDPDTVFQVGRAKIG